MRGSSGIELHAKLTELPLNKRFVQQECRSNGVQHKDVKAFTSERSLNNYVVGITRLHSSPQNAFQ